VRIEPDQLLVLRTAEASLILGIVTSDGEVLLREGSYDSCPGHKEWLAAEPGLASRARFGFSLISLKGRVKCIMRASRVNPSECDFLLPQQAVDELKAIFPLDGDFKVYGH
jgi:hypothetical protein